MRFLIAIQLALFALSIPMPVLAAPNTFKGLVELLVGIINTAIIPLIFALSLLVFLWGVFQYMFFPYSEERRTQGRQVMMWGVIALTVMASVWGIVKIVSTTFF